jgi:hypothetical protein
MPTKPRPKYIAARPFSCAGSQFAAGDTVDNPVVLDAVLRFGGRFVTIDTKRGRAAASTTEADPAADPTTEADPAAASTTDTPEE